MPPPTQMVEQPSIRHELQRHRHRLTGLLGTLPHQAIELHRMGKLGGPSKATIGSVELLQRMLYGRLQNSWN